MSRARWDRLYEIAATQEGLFTAKQAAEAGYSSQVLQHHLKARSITRVRRGIYRLVHYPLGEQEDLVSLWLWSEREGVFSHQTALALFGLSDVLPARLHLTLPESWRARRVAVPAGVHLHHAELSESDRSWVGVVPVTAPARTLADCAAAHFSGDLLRQAVEQAVARGLVGRKELTRIAQAAEHQVEGDRS